jgi:hypothetical protein
MQNPSVRISVRIGAGIGLACSWENLLSSGMSRVAGIMSCQTGRTTEQPVLLARSFKELKDTSESHLEGTWLGFAVL